jgi:hypothetical protein
LADDGGGILQALAPAAEVVLLGELGGVGLDQILRMGCASAYDDKR